jgi:hypothetical protein
MNMRLLSDFHFVNEISTPARRPVDEKQGITVPPFRKSHKSLTKPLIRISPSRLCAFARTPCPLKARSGLINLTQSRKAAKKRRGSDNFKECASFKKPRKSQEVDAESVCLCAREMWKMACRR